MFESGDCEEMVEFKSELKHVRLEKRIRSTRLLIW